MHPKTSASIYIGVYLLTVIGIAGYYRLQLRKAEIEIGLLGSRLEAVSVSRLDNQSFKSSSRDATEQLGPIVAPASIPTTNPLVPRTVSPAESSEDALDRLMIGNPELQEIYARQRTVRLMATYASFLRRANLSPMQLAAFERAIDTRSQVGIDINVAALSQGLKRTDAVMKSLLDQADAEERSALNVALGSQFDEFKKFQDTTAARSLSSNLAADLYDSSHPLTSAQGDRIAEIVLSSRKTPTGPADWDIILEKSKTVLSQQQLSALAARKEQLELAAKVAALTKAARAGATPVK